MPIRNARYFITTIVGVVILTFPCRAFGSTEVKKLAGRIEERSDSAAFRCKATNKGGRLILPKKRYPENQLKAAKKRCAPKTVFLAQVKRGDDKATLVDKGVLDLALFAQREGNHTLSIKNLTKKAKSVRYTVDGVVTLVSGRELDLEAKPPALYLAPGSHKLTITSFSRKHGKGTVLQVGTLSFTTVENRVAAASIDAPAPTLSVGKALPLVGTTTVPISISFAEPVIGFTERDVVLVGGGMNNFTAKNRGTASESFSLYTFELIVRVPAGSTTAEATVSVNAGAAIGSITGLQSTEAPTLVVGYMATQGTAPVVSPTPVSPTPTSATRTPTPTPRPTSTPLRTPTPTVRTPTPSTGATCSGELAPTNLTLPVFPGAEGHGRLAVGGSGRHLKSRCTRVFRVNSLANAGPGTLRECIEAAGPRVCVFETSGMIWANEPLRIRNPYITIAGQTAPSPGIAIKGSGIINEASEVVIQHLRLRIGDDPRAECCKSRSCAPDDQLRCTADPGSRDGITTWNTGSTEQRNVMYDHLSISWALDEGFSIVPDRADVSQVTLSNSIISSGLDMSIHPEASDPTDLGHSKGVLINGGKKVSKLSFLRTILAHNADRNIRATTPLVMEYVNNVVYNWGRGGGGGRTIELSNSVKALHTLDLINNRYRPGPDTFCPESTYSACEKVARNGTDSSSDRLRLHPMLRLGSGVSSGLNSASRYFVVGNITNTRPTSSMDEWSVVDNDFFQGDGKTLIYPGNRATSRVAQSGAVTLRTAEDGYQWTLLHSGARPADRDTVDVQLVEDVRNGTGQIINCVSSDGSERCTKNAGGWPTYSVNNRSLTLPSNENGDDDGDGYTNLEEWLHEQAGFVE